MKHENGKQCDRCVSLLEQAHPTISLWFYRIAEQFPGIHTCRVWCGQEEQDRLVLEKASLLKWPYSKHNYMMEGVPCALAMDLFRLTDAGEADFSAPLYFQINAWLEAQNAPITAGCTWKKFPDLDHFQLDDEAIPIVLKPT